VVRCTIFGRGIMASAMTNPAELAEKQPAVP
jgi:hypothetical protein